MGTMVKENSQHVSKNAACATKFGRKKQNSERYDIIGTG